MDATTHAGHLHDVHSDAHHHELNFLQKYIFSTDHKVIGIQYGVGALCFLFFGFCLMMMMRWSMAYPGQPIPVVGKLLLAVLGPEAAPNGAMGPDLYNSFGAMHGTIMVFLAIVPLAFAAFGNYVVPLQIGAPDMAFPRVNMASLQCFFLGGVVMFASFFIPGGAAKSGWTSYSPLATVAERGYLFNGQTFWILGMVLLITSSLLGAVNFIATIIQLRAPGMTWMRLPFFVWAQFVTAFLLLLAFPPLEAAGVMQLMDNLAGTSFFLPSGLMLGGSTPLPVSGGGSPLLWQHLFWFLGHPEVYVLILPGTWRWSRRRRASSSACSSPTRSSSRWPRSSADAPHAETPRVIDALLLSLQPFFAPAFTLWGTEASWLEIVAFVLAIAMVVLNMRVNALAWPLAIVSSLLYFALFWSSRLYGDASLQIFFAVIALWGWWQWLRGTAADGAALKVRTLPARARWALIGVLAIAWPATGLFLKTFTNTDVPWWDAFPTAASVIGQWLLGRKYIENWFAWIVVNVVSVGLFAYKGLWLTTLLYSLFIAMSFIGWRAWRKLAMP